MEKCIPYTREMWGFQLHYAACANIIYNTLQLLFENNSKNIQNVYMYTASTNDDKLINKFSITTKNEKYDKIPHTIRIYPMKIDYFENQITAHGLRVDLKYNNDDGDITESLGFTMDADSFDWTIKTKLDALDKIDGITTRSWTDFTTQCMNDYPDQFYRDHMISTVALGTSGPDKHEFTSNIANNVLYELNISNFKNERDICDKYKVRTDIKYRYAN